MNAIAVAVDQGTEQSFPPGGLVAQSRDAYQNAPLEIEEIRRGIYAFKGGGGTVTALRASNGCAVIDTGYGPRVDEIRKGIASALRQEPRFLIDTHWHFDHTDGNRVFAAHGASVIAHVNCRARMQKDQYVPSLEWRVPASPRDAWPGIVFDGTLTIDLHSEALQLLAQAPAHTDGDVAVLLPSANVLVLGDLFTNGSYPVIDESSGGSLRGMIEAVERLLPLIDAGTAVVPGHGPIGNRSALIDFRDMLRSVEDRVLNLIKSALTVQEIIRAVPTADHDPLFGRGYVTGAAFTRMVLAGLQPARTE
jgi:glyoxylase-like metal-dependent hydrolase (beta-lactamase superfamily II)